MARHHVLFTARGPTVFRNVRKTEHGLPLIVMDENAAIDVVCDFTAFLDSGETISSATTSATNVTCTPTTATPLVTLALTEPQGAGDIALAVTMSSGDKWAGTLKVERNEYPSSPSRYR